ncbi:MAG: SDR family NAD(P)-dependent oxidoreductase [Planctomycetota bacterium]|jgi:NAD(P)-dependent dehydrogenase (short-subunit alcohol dehydrogenase family)
MGDRPTCIIVGATGGIGRPLCSRLAARGWGLVLAARHEDPLRETAAELGDAVVGTAALDASDADRVASLFTDHGDVTAAVNLAGSILVKPAHSTSGPELDQTIDQNIRTAFSLVRAAGRSMRRNGGSVVLMSSCAARIGLPNHEAISAAKAAVEGLVRSAAATYAPSNLRFNAVAPGLTDTPLAAAITGSEASLRASTAMHPLGRIGQPDEVARVIEFLVDPESSWITGQVLGVDGGLSAARAREALSSSAPRG